MSMLQTLSRQSSGEISNYSEEEIQALLEERRKALEDEVGISGATKTQFERPAERPFSKAERPHTTVLFGGLTWKHERLIQAALEGLGYRSAMLPTPDVNAFQLGKEFGNNGQCNPTYFTVGNLVQYLQELERSGLSRDEILSQYLFITAGACGPCRFGMYEAEYRLALRNSGFEGFRVVLFQQKGGFEQSGVGDGLELNVDFFLALLNAVAIGDLMNEVAYTIRPYEVNVGETERVLEESIADVAAVFRNRQQRIGPMRIGELFTKFSNLNQRIRYLSRWIDQLRSEAYTTVVARCYKRFADIPVDRFRVRPIVKITGEFWAQTTEGDGNFGMFSFLEREGAQVLVEPVGTWLMYMLHQAKQKAQDRQGLRQTQSERASLSVLGGIFGSVGNALRSSQKQAVLTLAETLFRREWNRLRVAFGNIPHELTDQYHLQRIAHPYYNSRASGGEGHLEVAKNIYYTNKSLCHMVLSLKPFGCMPSTQSDGVQSAVVNHFKDIIYLPIETSGEGEVNAHSRVQMALGEARNKASEEFHRVLATAKHSLDEMKQFVQSRPELVRAGSEVPHRSGIVGTAANFVHFVDTLMSR